jgi:hypothetical protein
MNRFSPVTELRSRSEILNRIDPKPKRQGALQHFEVTSAHD